MLKIIGPGRSSDGSATLRLEGAVVGAWVDELQRVCEPLVARSGRLTLDLARVSFVSREGVALLLKLRDCRVDLTNCSRFVAEQLKARPA